MKVTEYTVTNQNKTPNRSGVGGYQPKYVQGNNFIKSQAYIGRGYVDDWMIEVIASKLGKQLGFNIVNQEPCIIKENRGIVKIYGVASDNFETESIHFVSIKRLLGED